MKIAFDIRNNSDSYIIIRVGGEYEQHAHIKTKRTCDKLIKLIKSNKLPMSEYLQGSCKRLLTDEEYARLRPFKQMYYNVNKGARK